MGGDERQGGGPRGGLIRSLVGVVILAGVVILLVYLGAATETFRDFVRGQLEKRLGMELALERTRIAWPLTIVADRVTSKEFKWGQGPGFRAREIRLSPCLTGPTRISVLRPELTLVRGEDRLWIPAAFSRVGDIPLRNLSEVSRLTREHHGRLDIEVREGSVIWQDAEGQEMASASGVFFRSLPVPIPGGVLQYHRLTVYNMLGVDGGRVRDAEREWVSSAEKDYLELDRSGQPIPASGLQFWETGNDERQGG